MNLFYVFQLKLNNHHEQYQVDFVVIFYPLIKSLVVIEPDLPCNKVDSCLLRCISFIKQTNMLLDFKGIPQVDETITSTSLYGISPTYISIKRL